MSFTTNNEYINALQKGYIVPLKETIYGTKEEKGLKSIINKAFRNRIIYLLLLFALAIVSNIGLFDGFNEYFDITTLLASIGLGGTGIAVKYQDIKEAFVDRTKTIEKLGQIYRLFKGQLLSMRPLTDKELENEIKQFKSMVKSIKPLFSIDYDDVALLPEIEKIFDECNAVYSPRS